jgi:LacI family transcriptional regulator
MDNRRLARYLVNEWLGEVPGPRVLLVSGFSGFPGSPGPGSRILVASRSVFRGGEGARLASGRRSASGGRTGAHRDHRQRWLDTLGLPARVDALDRHADIEAVYSIGGGNGPSSTPWTAAPPAGRSSRTTLTDNRDPLEAGRLSAVLYDLRWTARACQIIMQAHRRPDGPSSPRPPIRSSPFNIRRDPPSPPRCLSAKLLPV